MVYPKMSFPKMTEGQRKEKYKNMETDTNTDRNV